MSTDSTVILITGASSGIGKRTAHYLACKGYRVFGTSRHPDGSTIEGVTMVVLDVTSEASVARCVHTVIEQAGQIDVLINNAGVLLYGALEETSIEEMKQLFETNLFGLVRMTQAVLPHMRDRGTGKVINVGSMSGSVGLPFITGYSASKHAIKGITDGMRYELAPFGIQAYLVQPNIFKSEISHRSTGISHPLPDYDQVRYRVSRSFEYLIDHGLDPLPISRCIERIIAGRTRRWFHPVGTDARLSTLRPFVPAALFERHIAWRLNLTEQRHTFYHRIIRWLYRFLGWHDGELPPDL